MHKPHTPFGQGQGAGELPWEQCSPRGSGQLGTALRVALCQGQSIICSVELGLPRCAGVSTFVCPLVEVCHSRIASFFFFFFFFLNFGQPAQLSPASFAEPAASGRASRDAISASAAELSQWSSQLQPPAAPTCCSSLFSPGTVTVSFQTESSARCAAVQCRQ